MHSPAVDSMQDACELLIRSESRQTPFFAASSADSRLSESPTTTFTLDALFFDPIPHPDAETVRAKIDTAKDMSLM
jgi:hypothetical protein